MGNETVKKTLLRSSSEILWKEEIEIFLSEEKTHHIHDFEVHEQNIANSEAISFIERSYFRKLISITKREKR